ncbi:MAG: hypothetical protein RIF33_04470 [Cyclobacteriaceae bacterium]
MIIERTDKEVIFRLPADMNLEALQRVFDYLRFKELTKDSVATEEDANSLADESKQVWWAKNKSRFIK